MSSNLVELASFIPRVVVDLRYATARNFLRRAFYESSSARLREPTAQKLRAVVEAAAARGLTLKVWDAYRPAAAQRMMWEACPDPRFVAPPERGSRHTRGAAVDVTLVRLSDGAELPMGTDFDDFTPRAAADFRELPSEALNNRRLLRELMLRHGFSGIQSEWWHFDDADWEQFPLLES